MQLRIIFSFFLLSSLFNFGSNVFAQPIINCGAATQYIYYASNSAFIMRYDPTLPLSATNPTPTTVPNSGGGLAVTNNLNGGAQSPTFYSTSGSYNWWNGTAWVNTGHTSGAVNPGGGVGDMYSLEGVQGNVYRYDGTGNATFAFTIPGWNMSGPFDLVMDVQGNIYALDVMNATLRKFSPTGVQLQTWALTGSVPVASGGGFGIVNNTLVYDNMSGLWQGPIGATTIPVVNIGPSLGPNDFASCPINLSCNVTASIDTGYQCIGGAPLAVTATGPDTLKWTLLSGTATITGTGTAVTIDASTTSRILVATTEICADSTDTVTIIVPTATLNAGADETIIGCGIYNDTLSAIISNITPGLTYTPSWEPTANVLANGSTYSPTVTMTATTTFILTVETDPNQGGCTWTDTVVRHVQNEMPTAAFDYETFFGCTEDTIVFKNNSTNYDSSLWNFDDGSISVSQNPVHIYKNQNTFNVKLKVKNRYCEDSVTQTIVTNHPLIASFTVDDDSVCQTQTIAFTDASTVTLKPGAYLYDFGDGNTSTNPNPLHTYARPGIYNVSLVVTDTIPCSDTFFKTIVVDSTPFLRLIAPTQNLCEGGISVFTAEYLDTGLVSIRWDISDGYSISNINPLARSFDSSGVYTVTITADYRICDDLTETVQVDVKPNPEIDLGPDTSYCPRSKALLITDYLNQNIAGATWLWSTGATTPTVAVTHEGRLAATVTVDGCSSTDSIEIFKDCYLDIPNAFTPNGDQENDYFLPRQLLSRGVTAFSMKIYNRWGEQIYVTNKIDGRGWDGRFGNMEQPLGVYIYVIDVTFKNGISENYKGNVTLLR